MHALSTSMQDFRPYGRLACSPSLLALALADAISARSGGNIEALGGEPYPPALAERRLAVEQSKARYRVLRSIHRQIASDLAGMQHEQAAKIVERALRNIVVWESGGVSSHYYAKPWRRILKDPIQRIPKMFGGHMADALVQNSPFGFLYRQPKFRKQLFWP